MSLTYESELPVFRGSSRKGFGLAGTLTSGLIKYAIPLAKNFLSNYKSDIISTGKKILRDVTVKKIPFKKSFKTRSRHTLKKILTRKKNKSQSGSGIRVNNKQSRSGIKQCHSKSIKRKKNTDISSVPKKKPKRTHGKKNIRKKVNKKEGKKKDIFKK